MPAPKLELTEDQFTELHAAVDKTRASSQSVTVPKALLAKLLRDHSRLVRQDEAFRRPWAQPVAA